MKKGLERSSEQYTYDVEEVEKSKNKAIEVGQTLHNGATVIRFNEKVILARWTNDITPYVTWRYINNDPDTTALGHYFENFEDAEKDFLTR